jgi:hypothetical protein
MTLMDVLLTADDGEIEISETMFRRPTLLGIVAAVALLCASPAISGTLNVTNRARYVGSFGLEIVVDDQSPTYVQDNTPADEMTYRARITSA